MLRSLALATLLSLPTPFAWADAPDTQLHTLVSQELPAYVRGVDVSSLSQSQLAAIYSILHSDKSGGDKTALIRSVLGGRYSLRHLFFN